MRRAILVSLSLLLVSPVVTGEGIFTYDAGSRRDPFRPLVDKDGNILPEARPVNTSVELNLEGIVWSGKGDSYAILGGTIVKAGDMLGDYKVKSVEKTRVVLQREGEESVINLRGEEE